MQSIHKHKRKKNIFIYIVVIVVILIINPFNFFGSIRNIIAIPLTPIIQIGSGFGSYISEHVDMILHIGSLYEENQFLNNEIQQLKADNSFIADIKNENEILRKEIKLLPRDKFELIGADVILRDPLGGNQWIMINRGSDDGLQVGNGVIVGESIFIGEIDEISNATARVRLITSSENSVNIVTARTSSEAIAYGKHGLSVVVEDIKKDDDVVEGDMFVTSNIGNIFPRGLNIGIVQNIKLSDDNLFKKATIAPLVSLDNIRFVFIIK